MAVGFGDLMTYYIIVIDIVSPVAYIKHFIKINNIHGDA